MNNNVYRILDVVSLINNTRLRGLVKNFFAQEVPDYFFTIPASSSGKYHPDQDLGEGGLVRHTLMDTTIAFELLQMDQYKKLREYQDEIIAALLIHDSFKQGETECGHTVHEHPLIAAEKFKEFCFWFNDKNDSVKRIVHAVARHSGQWTTSPYSNVILPKPTTAMDKFVHLCDYIGSRKFIGDLEKYED